MNIHDWSLIGFTILAQMSAGAFVVLGIIHFFVSQKAGMAEADRMSDRALLAIGPVLGLGFIASLFHLGNPFQAFLAVSNFESSWLSREILFGVLFAGTGGLFALMQWRKIGGFAVRRILALAAAVIGLALVLAISQVYMLRTVPVWNSWATPVSFFATTFLLGGLAIGTALVVNYSMVKGKDPECAELQCDLLRWSLRFIALLSLVLLGVQVITWPWYIATLASGSAIAAAATLTGSFASLFVLRVVLVFLGAGVVGFFLYRNTLQTGNEIAMGNLAVVAFALVLVGEVMGRFLFYASYIRLGL
jgi:anaerobic dimethyl sulfoxide reductase subunit C